MKTTKMHETLEKRIGRTIYFCFILTQYLIILNVSALSENWRNIHKSIINHKLDCLSLKRVKPLHFCSNINGSESSGYVMFNDESLLRLSESWTLRCFVSVFRFQARARPLPPRFFLLLRLPDLFLLPSMLHYETSPLIGQTIWDEPVGITPAWFMTAQTKS